MLELPLEKKENCWMKLAYSFPASTLISRTLLGPWRALSFPLSLSSFNQVPIMAEKAESTGSNVRRIATASSDSFHDVLYSESDGGWEKCWKKGLTPWDLGQPTPILVHLHKTGSLPNGMALIPGCGSGYDVMAIACPERHVVGLDLSEDALNKAVELSSSSPNADYCTFVKANFFKWWPTESFDLIFDYTFFCAIEPSLRSAWAIKVGDLLKSDGELLTLIFPISDHEGGPPYKVSVTDYEEVLHPLGFKAITIEDNDLAIKPRKGREKIARWKRCPSVSSL